MSRGQNDSDLTVQNRYKTFLGAKMTKLVTLLLLLITNSTSYAQPAPTISQDIAIDGPKAKSLYIQLNEVPEKRTNRKSSTKNARSADGSRIGCEVYDNGEAYCVISLRGLVAI